MLKPEMRGACSSTMHSSLSSPAAGHKLCDRPLPHASERLVQLSWGHTEVQHRQSHAAHLNVGLALDPVEVFMQPIEQRPQQLLAVLLPIPSKLRPPLCNLGLELARGDVADVALQSSKEGGVRAECRGTAVSGTQLVLLCMDACTGPRGR